MAGSQNVNQIYYLVKRGSALPEGVESSAVIFVPFTKISVCQLHISMISALGEGNSIAGVSGTNFIYSPEIKRNVDKGWLLM